MRKTTRVGLTLTLLATLATGGWAQDKIVGYLLGAGPAGTQEVIDALNVKAVRDLGAKLELNYIGWNELNSKYPLVLAAGEGIDWIYAASWSPFPGQVARGAYKELTMDLIKKYMPLTYANLPSEAWDQVKTNGKIYMIPCATPDRKTPVAVIRGDLRKKFGLPPIKKFSEIEAYLAAVKKNSPDIIPMNLGNGYDLVGPMTALFSATLPPGIPVIGTEYLNYEDPAHGLYNLLDEPYLSEVKKAARTVKRWYDAGFINKAPYANSVLSKASFAQGKSAVGFGNGNDIQPVIAQAKDAGYEPEIIPILSSTGHSMAELYNVNGVAIAAKSKNWEKTLQFLDRLMNDKEYVTVAYYGIEGKNYALTSDGKMTLPAGVSADTNTYPIDASGFWFVNKELYQMASWTSDFIAYKNSLGKILVPNRSADFTFIQEKVKSEVASVTAVIDQYMTPIYIGGVPDVDKAFETLSGKLKAARLEKIITEVKAQLKAQYQK